MTPLESLESDATIWSIILELSITILEVSFTLIYDVYSLGITYAALVPDMFWNFNLVKNYKIANNATTTKAGVKK
jgi:hypothetical protein